MTEILKKIKSWFTVNDVEQRRQRELLLRDYKPLINHYSLLDLSDVLVDIKGKLTKSCVRVTDYDRYDVRKVPEEFVHLSLEGESWTEIRLVDLNIAIAITRFGLIFPNYDEFVFEDMEIYIPNNMEEDSTILEFRYLDRILDSISNSKKVLS